MLEATFRFRPICLRNIRITTTLLQKGANQGLNLEQIGQILCRPDEDDTLPSLLERIVDKARLITDMMFKMQGKFVDYKLRSIGKEQELKADKQHPFDQEDLAFGSRRQRAGSNYDNIKTREFGGALSAETKKIPMNNGAPSSFLASL